MINCKIDLNKLDNEVVDKIYKRFPDAQIKSKDDFWIWKLMPKKYRKFATTIGKTIWWPAHDDLEDPDPLLLIHEYDHLAYFYENGFLLTAYRYLSPHINFLLFLIAFVISIFMKAPFVISGILGIFGLTKLLPLGSWSRAKIEARAMSLQILVAEVINFHPDFFKLKSERQLTSWTYYKPLWDINKARNLLMAYMNKPVSEMSIAAQDVYEIVHKMLAKEGKL